jgi:hypothetical protein
VDLTNARTEEIDEMHPKQSSIDFAQIALNHRQLMMVNAIVTQTIIIAIRQLSNELSNESDKRMLHASR